MRSDYIVRPMTTADLPEVERLTDATWFDLHQRTQRRDGPVPEHRSPAARETWTESAAHLLATDPRGCWVAEDPAGVLGVAVGPRRELMWILSTFAVRPGYQGRGVGRQLLEAVQSYGSGCLRAMLSSSEDPRAVRRYRLAGLTLHPTMVLRGAVPRACLPVVERVREGSLGDVDLMDSVDRQTRGAAHGPDHAVLARRLRLVVLDAMTGSGYAYVAPGGGPALLAATNRRTATALLWETLAATSPDRPVAVGHVSAANEWALDVGLAARLSLSTSGYLGLRGMRPPAPYLHHGRFL